MQREEKLRRVQKDMLPQPDASRLEPPMETGGDTGKLYRQIIGAKPGMTRREMLGLTLSSAATAAVAGYIGSSLHLRQVKKQLGILDVERLEKFALKTQKGIELCNYIKPSVDLSGYENNFRISLGLNFSFKSFLTILYLNNFPKARKMIAADIGGGTGKAAEELDKLPGVEAFVIDPRTDILGPDQGLPKERFIIRRIEETGLPDNTFHFMMSHNAMHYAKLPDSFTETYRLLKPGGVALLDHWLWYEPDVLTKLDSLPIRDKVSVVWNPLGQVDIQPLEIFVTAAKNVIKEYGGEKSKIATIWPVFVIQK